jgi:hypothetical protein
MNRAERENLHQHLRHALTAEIRSSVDAAVRSLGRKRAPIAADLLTEQIVSTFILVLNWWIESRSSLSSQEVNDVFLRLICPTLAAVAEPEDE